ncbi:hypothetical protein, partial [Shewanella oncorhynchi]
SALISFNVDFNPSSLAMKVTSASVLFLAIFYLLSLVFLGLVYCIVFPSFISTLVVSHLQNVI